MILIIIISLIGYMIGLYFGFSNFSLYHGPNSNDLKKITFIEKKNNNIKRFKYVPRIIKY